MEAVNISKAFGATTALVDVSLKAYAGRILTLLGDNGAGKSTLIKILSGVFPPDRGELRFRGEPVVLHQPRPGARARYRHGLPGPRGLRAALGHPEHRPRPRAAEGLRAVQMARPQARRRDGALGPAPARACAGSAASTSGASTSRAASASRWPSRGRCSSAPRCLILDEPTSALAVRQAGRVLDHIAHARDQGQAVILITHNFRHALSVADDLTVLAQGRAVGHFRRDEIELDDLTDLVARVA